MDSPLKRPEEILAYRSLREILGAKPRSLWSVGPAESALSALQIMADKNIGFLVVLERDAIVGVLSERDCQLHRPPLGRGDPFADRVRIAKREEAMLPGHGAT